MTQSTQGIIIALLISLLIGVIVGFYLRQSRINDLSNALKQQKKRTEEIEQEHEKRLQDATLQLQKDYEQQLADKIELYQTQYDDQISQLEAEYDARRNMMGPEAGGGIGGGNPVALGAAMMGAGAPADAIAIEQRIRKQYETRLKEAAQKIQQAYEQHLKVKLNESREALQKDYETRLAEKIEHYQDQLDAQLAQVPSPMPLAMEAVTPYPDADLITSGVMSPAAMSSGQRDELEAELRREYEQKLAEKIEHYQDDMAQRLEELEQEYEARFRMVQSAPPEAAAPVESAPSAAPLAELETQLRLQLEEQFKTDYDHRLAEAIERYQDEMVQRTQELEQEYEARLQLVQQQMVVAPPSSEPTAEDSGLDDILVAESTFLVEAVTTSEVQAPPEAEMTFLEDEGVRPSQEEMIVPDDGIENAFQEGIGFPGEDALDTSQVEDALFSDQSTGEDLGLDFETSDPISFDGVDEPSLGLGLDEAAQPATPEPTQDDSLDLDDLLTMDQGENLVADQPPLDDGGFDLDNLEALLQQQDEDDDDADNIFDNLDDLSNLS